MSEMVERVAKVLQESCARDGMHIDVARHMARAAIEAMREPTEAMLTVGEDVIFDEQHEYGDELLKLPPAWQVMIDEALK